MSTPLSTIKGIAAGFFLATMLAVAAPAAAQETPPSFAPVAKRLLPAVVNISTRMTQETTGELPTEQLPPDHPLRDFFENFGGMPDQAPRQLHSLGSGFIIDSEGYVVTNDHVVQEAEEITVVLQDDTRLTARVVGTDPKTDLAVLKVDADRELTEVEWGNSEEMEVGDWVLAIGNPFGLGETVTAGIVSARGRDINAGPYSRFIQTDTAINQGNSGGPLFNARGKVVGVNTAILSPTGGSVGVGFALPTKVAKPIIDELRETGTVTRGWLGVTVQPLTDELASGLDLPRKKGALISETIPDGPAARAGLRQGDVVFGFAGENVTDSGQLAWLVSQRDPGEEVGLEVWRDGETTTKTATLGKIPESEDLEAAAEPEPPVEEGAVIAKTLGLKLTHANEKTREQFDLPPSLDGAVVAAVAPNGPAARRGIRPGDMIRQVGRDEVDGPEEVNRVLEKAVEDKVTSVVLLVQRGNNAQFVATPLATPQAG